MSHCILAHQAKHSSGILHRSQSDLSGNGLLRGFMILSIFAESRVFTLRIFFPNGNFRNYFKEWHIYYAVFVLGTVLILFCYGLRSLYPLSIIFLRSIRGKRLRILKLIQAITTPIFEISATIWYC